LALPLGLALIFVSLAIKSQMFRDTVRYSLQGVALLLVFVGLFTPGGRITVLFLEMPAMRWMGRMSYAAYLWHVEWVYAGEHFLGREATTLGLGLKTLYAAAGCGVTFGIAAVSYYYIYRPVLTLRRRFGSHAM
jgi:peptidoglycan/LPS O-acetylase OafA/YrhL